jgi:putative ABC transport system permease protein
MSDWLIPFDIGLIQGLLFACAVLGFAIALRVLRFPDLTVEGSLLLGAAVFGSAQIAHWSFAAAFVAALTSGAVAGATTAALHLYMRMNRFLAGILVIAATYSLSLRIMQGSNISLLNIKTPLEQLARFNRLGPRDTHFGDAALLGICVVGIAIASTVLLRSRMGMRFRAAGSNPQHARALGIPVSLVLIGGLAATNALAAISGVLLASYQGFADVGIGQGTLIIVLASLSIGERFLSSVRISEYVAVVIAACVGAITYQILIAFAVRLGLAPTDLKLVTALIVLIVVAIRARRADDLLMEPV